MQDSGYRTNATCLIKPANVLRPPTYRATVVDISTDGAQVLCATPIPQGTPIKVAVENQAMSELDAAIVSNAGDSGRGYRLGLQLRNCSWPYTVFVSLVSLSSTTYEDPRRSPPSCLAELGVSYPCTQNEVEMAFQRLVRKAHPDRGGKVEDFVRLRAAYLEALEFLGARR